MFERSTRWTLREKTRLRLCVAVTAAMTAASAAGGCDSKSDDDRHESPSTSTPAPTGSTAPNTPTAPTTQGTTPSTPSGSAPAPAPMGTTPNTSTGATSQQSGNPDASAPGNVDGTYFADVTANGTGCPAGTWETQLSDDKRSFTITFSAFDAKVDPASMVSVKDCQLALKIKSKKPVAYAVQTFSFEGYAQLQAGVSARLLANYYFQGSPKQDAKDEVEFKGEYDKEYAFSQNIALPEQVWSDCGLERDLNVRTTVRLLNASPGKEGKVNVAQAKGKPKLFVQLSERPCP
jgi:hypothetical protein